MIRDDDLYEILVKELRDGVHMTSLMDCCHSGRLRVQLASLNQIAFVQFTKLASFTIILSVVGSIMDLPYIFKGDGSQTEMILDPEMNMDAFIEQITGKLMEFLMKKLGL